MASVGKLTIEMAANVARLQKDMNRATRSVDGAMQKMKRAAGTAMKAIAGIGGVIAIAGLSRIVKKSLDAADAIGKTSDAAGIMTSTLQELRHAADLSGVSAGTLDKAMEKFGKTVGELRAGTGSLYTILNKNNKALLEQLQAAGNTDQAFNILMGSMAGMAKQTDRAALSAAAFGRSGVKMTVMLKGGIAGLNQMRQEARDLGLVIDDALIRNSEMANDKLSTLTRVIKTQLTAAIITLAPDIAEVAQNMTNWVVANKKLITQKVEDTLKAIATGLKSIVTIYNSIPSGVIAAGSAGIIGRMLLGPQAGATIGLLVYAEHLLKKIGLPTIWENIKGIQEAANNVLKGDWSGSVGYHGGSGGGVIGKTAKQAAIVHHEATEEMITDAYNLRHWWNETTNAMSEDWAGINEEIEGNFKEVVGPQGEMKQAAEEGFDAIGELAQYKLSAMFQGQFDSIGGFFKDMLNNMYSMFASWAAKIAAQKIVIPMATAFTAGAAGTAMAAGGGALGSIPGGGLLSGAASFAGNLVGGAQLGIASFLGNSSSLLLQDMGMALVGMNPLLFAGGMALGALGLGKVISKLFGGKPHEPHMGINLGFAQDVSGNYIGQGIETYNPQYYEGDAYSRSQKYGIPYYGAGHLRGSGTIPFNDFNAAITEVVDGFLTNVNNLGEALPDSLSGAFSTAIDSIFSDYFFETKYHGKHPDEWVEEAFEELGASLDEAFGPTVDLFTALNSTLNNVIPGFGELIDTLVQATDSYFNPLLAIDEQLANAGGLDYRFSDLVDRADTYKLLFDNAVANGSAAAWQLGQQYAGSLVELNPYAENLDLASELATIREQMIGTAGTPEDFQASVLTTLEGFKQGVQDSIDAITTAIKELHPEITLDIDVDMQVNDTDVEYEAEVVQRGVA